jgi:UDP-glucose 4-epimerase
VGFRTNPEGNRHLSILITGVAGYIGSIVAHRLINSGHPVTGIDNLKSGSVNAIPEGVRFAQVNLSDQDSLKQLLLEHDITAVIHLAGDIVISESISNPEATFANNVTGSLSLLNCMREVGVNRIIFASSAAVYGNHSSQNPIDENTVTLPINPYGESKLMVERILLDYHKAYGLKSISLRYFNVAGATELYGENHHPETHLIPRLLDAALHQTEPIPIFGTHHDTKDGTAVRDFIHVEDLATAHVNALDRIDPLSQGVFNLGSGLGHSVLEVIESVERITKKKLRWTAANPRPGDPPILVADNNAAKRSLSWTPIYSLEQIVYSAWEWRQLHPNGYK